MLSGLVSHYRVVGPLGAGGMGVVYKAIDTRLNRPVAIKALNEKSVLDTNAALRLRREALAAASLDHPYICKIYELLETDAGALLVMEFVEGETLADMLGRGVPPLVDTLRYGTEIAEGLANAHASGLVHRDIKPSNIMVTPHGHVKLLDFGVVRTNDFGTGATMTRSALTGPGAVAGTPFYMAPEQALGEPVDGRSDLFSLGAVLFQCLTGELPFEGATRDAYVQAMLAGRWRALDQLAPAVPAPVSRLVRQCLERDRSKRVASAATLATELRRSAEAMSGYATAVAVQRASRIRSVVQVLLTVAAVAVIAVAYQMWKTSAPPADSPSRTIIAAVTWASSESDPRLSPDGRWLSFLSDRDGPIKLFVQQLDGGKAVAVDVPGVTVISHAWSPDGREIACVVRQQRNVFLQIVPAFFGGLPRVSIPLTPAPESVRVVRWMGGDVLLDVNRGFAGRPLWQVTIATGAIVDRKASWPSDLVTRTLDVSPDGRDVVFAAKKDGHDDLWVAGIDGSGVKRLTNDEFVEREPVWIGSTGVVAYQSSRGGQLDIWQTDSRSLRSTQVTSSPTVEVPAGSTPDGSVLAFVQTASSAALFALEPPSVPNQLTADALSDFWPSIALDGRRVAFQRTLPTVREGFEYFDSRVLVMDRGVAPATAEPQNVGDGFGSRLSPDGMWVAYLQRSPDPRRLLLQARNLRSGASRPIWDRCPLVGLTSRPPVDWVDQHLAWRPGTTELFFIGDQDGGPFIGRIDLAASGPVATVVGSQPGVSFVDIRPSPDGTRLAYLASRTPLPSRDAPAPARRIAVFELHVRDLATGRDTLVTTEPGSMVEPMLRGWSGSESFVVLLSRPTAAAAFDVDIIEINASGARRPIATISEAFGATARVDAPRRRVLLTREEAGVQNIVSVSLSDGRTERVTDNHLPGISYAGIELLASGGIVYSRPEWKRDIWLARQPGR